MNNASPGQQGCALKAKLFHFMALFRAMA